LCQTLSYLDWAQFQNEAGAQSQCPGEILLN
jgi:hypothetical protein